MENKENGQHPDIKGVLVVATNRIVEAKQHPGNDNHAKTMENLLELLSNTPGAVKELSRLQNGQ